MKNRNLDPSDHWKTPKSFYDSLDKIYNFDFDPCPYMHNTEFWDGLKIPWGERNFVNPPYSLNLKEAFIKKAYLEHLRGKLSVMLLPVSTSTKVFHKYILPYASVEFLEGRISFEGINTRGELVKDGSGQFDSMLVIYKGEKCQNHNRRHIR